MFAILRFVLIVGAIFYYSPVRKSGDGIASLDALLGWKRADLEAKAATPSPEASDRLETMWKALPESARQAVIDKILTTSGLGAVTEKPTDTLRASDLQPAWRGEANKPRT